MLPSGPREHDTLSVPSRGCHVLVHPRGRRGIHSDACSRVACQWPPSLSVAVAAVVTVLGRGRSLTGSLGLRPAGDAGTTRIPPRFTGENAAPFGERL